MRVFRLIVFIITIIVIPLAAILYIKEQENYEEFLKSDPKLLEIVDKFRKFFTKDREWKYPLTKLNNTDVMKTKFLRGNKSYTINKEVVYICLKDENGNYYNDNMLVYVTAHELAHVLCDEIGHTDSFHEINESLLNELIKEGLYNPSIPVLKNYCKDGDPEIL
tara:strand:- start:507 stop:998 length:492 start_codon:yes stop_codon:yes gene_type:complete